MPNEVKFSFPYGETQFLNVVAVDEIAEHSPTLPGIYSWHIRVVPGHEEKLLSTADSFFSQKTLDATVSGNMRFKYNGKLEKVVNPLPNISEGLMADENAGAIIHH
jgi:hypothetical protein